MFQAPLQELGVCQKIKTNKNMPALAANGGCRSPVDQQKMDWECE